MNDIAYQLKHVEHHYGTRTVVKLPALEIFEGEIFALVGPSGAGKSTLLRLLALLEMPSQGVLTYHGVTAAAASLDQRRQIALLAQRPVMISRSVYDNVAYGLRLRGQADSSSKINRMLEGVSLGMMAKAHPRTLSGGEIQRVALARTLILDTPVLLLDEPTANLDPANVRLIEALIRDHHQRNRTTIILVTHHIFQARRLADRVGLMLDGELIEVAASRDFFEQPSDPRTAGFISGELPY
jgi:tungstate transport system ATP-binding protein